MAELSREEGGWAGGPAQQAHGRGVSKDGRRNPNENAVGGEMRLGVRSEDGGGRVGGGLGLGWGWGRLGLGLGLVRVQSGLAACGRELNATHASLRLPG